MFVCGIWRPRLGAYRTGTDDESLYEANNDSIKGYMHLIDKTYLHYHVHQPSFTLLLSGQACNELKKMFHT